MVEPALLSTMMVFVEFAAIIIFNFVVIAETEFRSQCARHEPRRILGDSVLVVLVTVYFVWCVQWPGSCEGSSVETRSSSRM